MSEGAVVDPPEPVRQRHRLPVPSGPISVPSGCAGCGKPAPRTVSLRPAGRALLLPVCEACAAVQGRARSRRLGSALAGLLIGCSAALGLPLADRAVADSSSLTDQVRVALPYLMAVALVPLPWVVEWLVRPSALRLSADGKGLWVADQHWAREFCRLNQVESALGVPRPAPPRGLAPVLLVTALLAAGAYFGLRSELWVLNLSSGPADLWVDGERVLPGLQATAAESTGAGVRLSLVAGDHRLVLRRRDSELDASVSLRPGSPHILALGGQGECFWLESAGYGRAAAPLTRRALVGEPAFWALTEPIDLWFQPLPEPATMRLSTGGTLTALRRAPCLEAPAEVRNQVQ